MARKDDEPKVRNWVKKAADELGLKPSRHRDRKHDYSRRDKHRDPHASYAGSDETRTKGKREEYPREDSDWDGDINARWYDDYGLESEEDPSDPEEVQ